MKEVMHIQEDDFVDRTIIRLCRQYSKDELVAALHTKLREQGVELGKLRAYIDELETEIKNLKNGFGAAVTKEVMREKLYIQQAQRINSVKRDNKELIQRCADMAVQIYKLESDANHPRL